MRNRTRLYRFSVRSSQLAVGLIALSLVIPHAIRGPVVGIGIGWLLGYWLILGMIWYLRAIWVSFHQATVPIPSLQEIDAQLRQEGFNPSIADCVAVEQHLRANRNEAFLVNAALVFGPTLLAKQAQGRRPH